MILLSHPTGNQNSRNAARALHEGGILAEFWTSIAWRRGGIVDRILPKSLRAQLARRSFADLPVDRIRAVPWREMGRFAAPRCGLASLTRHEDGCLSVDAVFKDFDRRVAERVRGSSGIRRVYAGEDFALETFKAAHERGLSRIYELPIGYWRAARAIYRDEAEREPEWACTLGGLNDSEAKLERKDNELHAADVILVPSTFVRDTLEQLPGSPSRIFVNGYGAPVAENSGVFRSKGLNEKLRVLFVGALGQRKGLSYLLGAANQLEEAIDLTLLGRKTSESCKPLNAATQRHRWIPSLPHREVLIEMEKHDVLVFPSLFEGMALVILEALSRGLPVITTNHSGGSDVLRNGVDGYIVPIRSSESIAEHLEILVKDRKRLNDMKREALVTASRNSWEAYRRRLLDLVRIYPGHSVEELN